MRRVIIRSASAYIAVKEAVAHEHFDGGDSPLKLATRGSVEGHVTRRERSQLLGAHLELRQRHLVSIPCPPHGSRAVAPAAGLRQIEVEG